MAKQHGYKKWNKNLIAISIVIAVAVIVGASVVLNESNNLVGKAYTFPSNLRERPVIYRAACIPPPSGMIGWWSGDVMVPVPIFSRNPTFNIYEDSNIAPNRNTQLNTNAFATFARASTISGPSPGKVGMSYTYGNASFFGPIEVNGMERLNNVFTVDAWVLQLDYSAASRDYRPIVAKWDENHNFREWSLVITPRRELRFDTSPDGNFYSGNSLIGGSLGNNRWYHVAAVYDHGKSSLWLDGNLVAVKIVNNPGLAYFNQKLFIGSSPMWGGRQRHFNGVNGPMEWGTAYNSIDEVELFSRPLSESEIRSIYNAGSSGKCKPSLGVLQ